MSKKLAEEIQTGQFDLLQIETDDEEAKEETKTAKQIRDEQTAAKVVKAQQLLTDEFVQNVEDKSHEWIYGESFIYSVIIQSLQQRISLNFENRGPDREKLQALKEYHELGSLLHITVLPNNLSCFVTSIVC